MNSTTVYNIDDYADDLSAIILDPGYNQPIITEKLVSIDVKPSPNRITHDIIIKTKNLLLTTSFPLNQYGIAIPA